MKAFRFKSLAALLLVALTTRAAHAVTIDLVNVGNPGNAADTTGYGAVAYEYRIGKYEVTIQQYTDFLNAVAKSDPYSLYNENMATDANSRGISRAGASGSYSYGVIGPAGVTPPGASSPGNRPISYVSWFDAARFANWMANGQGTGSTETGAYTLVGGQTSGMAPVRNPGASFYVPTEDEWYKAAYYSPLLNSGSGGYYSLATQSDASPGNEIGDGVNQANHLNGVCYSVTRWHNYSGGQNYLSDVGAFTNSASHYGTFDQSGNVTEWNDLTGAASVARGRRGGHWEDYLSGPLRSSYRRAFEYPEENSRIGFRIAAEANPSPVPEIDPAGMGSILALVTGAIGLLERRRRKMA